MDKVTIQKPVTAWQWNGEEKDLPEKFHLCQPEVHYSAAKDVVYFTYADLSCEHWIGTLKLHEMPKTDALHYCIRTIQEDGKPYFRTVFPFSFYEIKSQASVSGDHSAKFLKVDNPEEMQMFLDYAALEKWDAGTKQEANTFCLPPRCEYRQSNGSYGRGYRPYYMKPGDWLVIDGPEIKVLPDAEFQAMKAAAGS